MKEPARGRVAVAVAVVAYLGLSLWSVSTQRYLHDEGLLSHLFAQLVGREFTAAFFLQKIRPPLAALYAPVASFGVTTFLVAHVVVGALAVWGTARIAKALGHREPAVAAFVVGLSPLFIASAAAGVSNLDAVAGLVLFGELFVVRRRVFAATVVLGMLVWVRAELAVFVALVIGALIRERSLRGLLGLPVFGLGYGLAGAAYHGDLLWMLRFPPTLTDPMPDNPYWQTHSGRADLVGAWETLLAISPAVVGIGLVRWSRLTRFERLGATFVIAFTGLLLLLPRWQVFNFDLSPRYLLPVLPFVALLVSRASERLGREGVRDTAWLVVIFGVAAAGVGQGAHSTPFVAVGLVAVAVAVVRFGQPAAAAVVALALVVLGPVTFADGTGLERRSESASLDALVVRLAEAHPGGKPRPVYTNEPLLAAYLDRTGALPWADVHYIVQADQRYELDRLANPDNGQRETLWQALQQGFYGKPVSPEGLQPQRLPPDVLFALRRDARLELVMPLSAWAPRLSIHYAGRRALVAELRAPQEVPR